MIPARIYMQIVKQYARANGMKFFTWHDQKKAIASYELFAALKN